MKILLYGLNFAPELTGIGKYSGEMALWLAARGHEVRVVCAVPYYPEWQVHQGYSAWRYHQERRLVGQGSIQITRCPLWVPQQLSGTRRLLHLLSFALTSLPVLLRQWAWRPDLLFAVAPALLVAPQAALASALGAWPSWLHIQDFEVDAALGLGMVRSGWLGRAAKWVEARVLRRFDVVSSISSAMCARLIKKGVDAHRVQLLHNWVDLSAISPCAGPNGVRAALGIADSSTLLLYAGNMGEKQGLDVLVDAARRLKGAPGLLFLMVGTGGAKVRLQAMAAGLDNMVWWPLQPVERLSELLTAADIHLLPQRSDAADLVMPSKLGGMLASGRVVIGTAHADTELGRVLDLTGVRIAPGDPALLADSILQLAGQPDRRRVLGETGRAYAEQTLDIDPVLTEFESAAAQLQPTPAPRAQR